MNDLIIIGAGGHAKVVADIAIKNGYNLLGFLDDSPKSETVVGYPVLGPIKDCHKYAQTASFAIGIGNGDVRERISAEYSFLSYPALIHPSSQIGLDVSIGEGTVVMAGTVISSSVNIGKFCIVNSCAVVEHDSSLGNYTHAAPRSTICGTVKVGENVWLGAGCTVNNNVIVCDDVFIGSGAVVIKNIVEKGLYVGVPAKRRHSEK